MAVPHRVALALLFAAGVLGACGEPTHFPALDDAADHFGLDPAAMVQVDEIRVVVPLAREQGTVELWGFRREPAGWTRSLQVVRHVADQEHSVCLLALPSGDVWAGAFAFGTAGPEAARVTLDRDGEVGGDVIAGAWVIISPGPVSARELSWRFLRADGSPILVGVGEVPPQP